MGNTLILRNLLRAVILMIFQVLVLNQINLGGKDFNYITIFVYPIFLMFLPITAPTWLLLIIGFFYGYCLDVFSDTIGIHTATCVFSVFIRSFLLNTLEPQGGYKDGTSPTRRRMGFPWFLRYASIFMFLHVFYFYCVEVFTLLYIGKIVMYTLPSFIISFILVMIYSFLFDPAD
jgi:hypothetical protein